MGKQILILMVGIAWSLMSWAQDGPPSYENKVYDPDIKSLRLNVESRDISIPIISWESQQKLFLKFDDLYPDVRNLFYTIIHCDMDWKPSRIRFDEYSDGFQEEPLRNYEYSVLTYEPYTHYRLTLPNERTRWLIPGNYLLYVYEDYPDKPIFTQRFVVVDQQVRFQPDLRRCPAEGKMLSHQCLNFIATNKYFDVRNPGTDLKAFAMQNANWNTLIEVPQRSFVQGTEDRYMYDIPNSASFQGRQDYYPLDIRTVLTPQRGVEFIERDEHGPIVYAWPRFARQDQAYISEIDLNGKYIIDNSDQPPPGGGRERDDLYKETYSEYVRVLFFLKSPKLNTNVYVYGEFCQWDLNSENLMIYDAEREEYYAELWLKQGYYDYEFVSQDEPDGPINFIGRSTYQAENDYQILMYYRGFNARYDRPIGVRFID